MNASTRRRNAGRALLAVLTMSALTGCGPDFGLSVGVKEVSQNVTLGDQHPPTPPPPPPALNLNPLPDFPLPVLPPPPNVPPPPPPPPPRPVACPDADAFAIPKPALTSANQLPATGVTYPFRYEGTITRPGAKALHVPGTGTRQVTAAQLDPQLSDAGAYTFDVVEKYNDLLTTTRYEVIPTHALPSDSTASKAAPAGVYLISMKTLSKAGGVSSFTPQPMIQIMTFPAWPDSGFGNTGVDGLTQQSMIVTPYATHEVDQPPAPPQTVTNPGSRVVGRDRVNACGRVVDSVQANLIGEFKGVTTDFTFNDDLDFATQFGGLIVKEHRRWTGTDSLGAFTLDMVATINQLPKEPHA